MQNTIQIRGAYRNNLRSVDLDLPLGSFTVVTGLSGSGKSSLAFDTIYAEGQRRYVETFSAYTRQFLERMDKPQVESIQGIPPAIAVDQTNPVRTSRSTVGTMTELADHLKLLWSHAAELHCRGCDRIVRRDTPESIWEDLHARVDAADGARVQVLFHVHIPENRSREDIREVLAGQGYHRILEEDASRLTVVQDRLRLRKDDPEIANRLREAAETAMLHGNGTCVVSVVDGPDIPYSDDLHCPHCDIHYSDPVPNSFSFNSPAGACPTCRGFGRTMGIDYDLVIPDHFVSLSDGAVRIWESKSYLEVKKDMLRFAKREGIRTSVPWGELTDEERQWVIEGEGDWDTGAWYGLRRFFDWLETKSYKMHIRVLLSRYRAYRLCHACHGARLKPESLQWKIRGYSIHNINLLPIDEVREFFESLDLQERVSQVDVSGPPPGAGAERVGAEYAAAEDPSAAYSAAAEPGTAASPSTERAGAGHSSAAGASAERAATDEAAALVHGEIKSRLAYLTDVGVGYLTLDRQSRTLSGGEVQRINLTTALGTRLTNTLFVLDEPSIGLHSRDIDRLVGILRRLCRGGNTLLVVEHDPQVILAADRVVELGPGAGSAGGRIVFEGTPDELHHADTATGRWLSGLAAARRAGTSAAGAADSRPVAGGSGTQVPAAAGHPTSDEPPADGPHLLLQGAREHNLRIGHLRVPLSQLLCVTGVSGSGKSTLVGDTIYRAILKHKGEPIEAPGAHDSLSGVEHIDHVNLVDQSSIGKTARSNPASYVGAFDEIRKRFSTAPRAIDRGYTTGTFSFNAGNGRCPTCGGTGFEHIEMQFLSDVYLRCADCGGTRYRREILDVTVPGADGSEMASASIADVLSMPVADAAVFFRDDPAVLRKLQPLVDVGLEYVTLGQPVPTLSGGEAQRLKLAGHLAGATAPGGARSKKHPGRVLFLLDEPTTGLHAQDVSRLLTALRHLIDRGHSVLVIEHNLDVIAAADWIIDIGPEGGREGGRCVDEGTPTDLARGGGGYTAAALRAHLGLEGPAHAGPQGRLTAGGDEPRADHSRDHASAENGKDPSADPAAADNQNAAAEAAPEYYASADASAATPAPLGVVNAREHNLRNISVEVPQNRMTVFTGVSGSGKSTLAFDIIFGEGQRRYLESLNAYARQFVQPAQRPEVDAVYGLPPSVAIEQRTSRGGWKSTVATTTELFHFMRLLFLKLGTQYCPDCAVPIEPRTRAGVLADIMREYAGRRVTLLAPLVVARKGYYTDLATWASRKGYSELRVDGALLPTDNWPRLARYKEHDIDLPVADIDIGPGNEGLLEHALSEGFSYGNNQLKVVPTEFIEQVDVHSAGGRLFSVERSCPSCGRSFPELDPRLFSFNSRHGACEQCHGSGYVGVSDEDLDVAPDTGAAPSAERFTVCPECHGSRLNSVARGVYFRDLSIDRLAAMSVDALSEWVEAVELSEREASIARDIKTELSARLGFLRRVGLGYLGLDRAAPTLSGGEAQRIRLAAQLGSNLRGVCYVLDEPTIGLHARDNRMLLDTLSELRDRGNTIVVVEHDADTIYAADHVIDLGPGGGVRGGEVVAVGSVDDILNAPDSRTGHALAHPPQHPAVPRRPRPEQSGPHGVHPDSTGAESGTGAGDPSAGPAAAGNPARPTGSDGSAGHAASTPPRPTAAETAAGAPPAESGTGAGKPAPEAASAAGGSATDDAARGSAETASATGAGGATFTAPAETAAPATPLRLEGAHLHNLKNINLEIPTSRLTCITGVSGCGKSTLARGVLRENAERIIAARTAARKAKRAAERTSGAAAKKGGSKRKRAGMPKPVGCTGVSGFDHIDRVLEVDQTPIGKTPRSCPATYVGIWDDIRKLFAATPEAKLHGFDASRFSFNTKGGRCETCGGQGVVRIEMSFLPDVRMKCETCRGARFTPDTLAVRYKGKNIAEVLDMSIEEARAYFSAHRKIYYALSLLDEVGLGYLKLGQQSPTLSGGEAQRLKLVTELAKAGGMRAGHTLYVLDEPTIGLHISDVERLTRVLIRLVDAGNTVVIVEHNLDVIAEADRIIDLGPEGGDDGGSVVATGTPLEVTDASPESHTARALAGHLQRSPTPVG